jgi:hypothetical protein
MPVTSRMRGAALPPGPPGVHRDGRDLAMADGHEHGDGTCTTDSSGAVVCVMSCRGHGGGRKGDDDDHGSSAGSGDHDGSGSGTHG